jgi:hypothetical protein
MPTAWVREPASRPTRANGEVKGTIKTRKKFFFIFSTTPAISPFQTQPMQDLVAGVMANNIHGRKLTLVPQVKKCKKVANVDFVHALPTDFSIGDAKT